MTIVAGFKCQGGVVLCADTQETAYQMKLSVEKLFLYEKEWCQAGIGGSGNNADIVVAITDPDRYQGDVYPKLPLGFTGHLPDRVLKLMVERNEEIYKQAATKQGTSYGPPTSDSQKSEDEL